MLIKITKDAIMTYTYKLGNNGPIAEVEDDVKITREEFKKEGQACLEDKMNGRFTMTDLEVLGMLKLRKEYMLLLDLKNLLGNKIDLVFIIFLSINYNEKSISLGS